MRPTLLAAALSLTLFAAPSWASTTDAGLQAAAEGESQLASLVQDISEQLSIEGLAAPAGQAPFQSIAPLRYAYALYSCDADSDTGIMHFDYTGTAPVVSAPSCQAAGPVAAGHALPPFLVAEASIDEAMEAEEASGLPEIPVVVNKSVESFIRYFQTNGRKHFEKWLGRSAEYMHMLQAILRENGLPEDLSYIALIESGLNPTVRSHANAVGMWQFIKGTAVRYGLRVDWWIDERRDPEKATYAAASYLKNLYGMFGSWYLAAAGYNAGEGRVARAIKKQGTEDFWELASKKKALHRETREYVPKYLAALTIAKDPEQYGFSPVVFTEGLRYDKVPVKQATDLRVIAVAAGTTVEEIRRLNPELLRWFTPPDYPGYQIKIPAGSAEVFMENMKKVPPAKRVSFVQHKIKRGDTLGRIAAKYGTEIKPIMHLNENLNPKRLRPGTVIMIPVRADRSASIESPFAAIEAVSITEPQG
ncbi:MAG: transglycosylase SLT domain-containing protein [Deltaproteobacteria bacterium]|nr:transglycosylase SLT domain-containing protein [Deltaproteobacteria bacterium]MCL4873725.1 transglycosylase SLT domain-containing protein [bacterium]